MKLIKLMLLLIIVNSAAYAANNSGTDIMKNGIFLDGINYTIISLQNTTEISTSENSTNFNFKLHYGIMVNDYWKFMILMPGILWEPINFNNNDKVYLGSFMGLTNYNIKFIEDDFIHNYQLSSINQLSYKLGNALQLNLQIPIHFIFTSQKYPTYDGLYKYNLVSANVELEKFITRTSSLSIRGELAYMFSLTKHIIVNYNYIVFSELQLNIKNTTFLNAAYQVMPEAADGAMKIIISIERRF